MQAYCVPLVELVTNNTTLFTNVCETMLSYNIVTNVVAMLLVCPCYIVVLISLTECILISI